MKKIRKNVARKEYEKHNPNLIMVATNLRPECGSYMCLGSARNDFNNFESLVNAYTYYNCNNETGRYPVFYLDE